MAGFETESRKVLSASNGILPLERKTNAEKNAFSAWYASSTEAEE
jgi:hypothetical protein